MLKQPNFFHNQPSALPKEVLARFYVSTTFGLSFMTHSVAPTRSSTFYAKSETVKSVQSTLSHLQSLPEQLQSQRNYGSFLSKSHLHGMILFAMLAQNHPKIKRQ